MQVGICQIKQGYDIPANISRAREMIEDCVKGGAEFVVLPEMFTTPYEPASIRNATPYTGQAFEMVRQCACRHEIHIVAGSLPFSAAGEQRVHNRCMVVDPQGNVIHQHDKIHLFDCTPPGGPAVRESATVMPGGRLKSFATPWGEAAVLICYDLRFGPLIQLLLDRNVRFLFVPAAFSTATGDAHWEMLVCQRAVDLQGYVIGVQPARNPALAYRPHGHSMVAGPWGELLMDAGEEENVKIVHLDPLACDKIRQTFPLSVHRRLDLYKTEWIGGD